MAGVTVSARVHIRRGRLRRGMKWLLRRIEQGKPVDERAFARIVAKAVRVEIR